MANSDAYVIWNEISGVEAGPGNEREEKNKITVRRKLKNGCVLEACLLRGYTE